MNIICKLKKLIISLVAMLFICGFTSFASEATFIGSPTVGKSCRFNDLINSIRSRSYVTEIKWSDTAPDSGVTTVNVGDNSGESILAWADENTIYLYTEADKVYMPKDSTAFLRKFTKLTNLDFLTNVDTSKVTDLDYAFSDMNSITSLDGLSNWNIPKVTSLYSTFSNMTSVTSLNGISTWNTSNIEALSFTFKGMSSVTSLDGISNWDTSKVTRLYCTFEGMSSVTNLDGISNWNTSNVTTLYNAFKGMSSVTSLDSLSNWDTSNVTDLESTFENMSSVTSLDGISNWDTSKVTTLAHTFYGMSSVTNLDGISNWNTSNVTVLSYTFYKMSKVDNIDSLSGWDTSKVTYLVSTFGRMTTVHNLDGISNWNTSNVTTLSGTFEKMSSVTSLDGISNWDTSKVTNLVCTFEEMSSVTSLDGISNWNTSNVTTLRGTFEEMSSVTSLDGISNWDTSKVTNLVDTFYGISVTNLDGLSNWNVSNVTTLDYTFRDMHSVTNLDGLSNWNVSNVTTLLYTFENMKSVTNLAGLSNWNTSNVTRLEGTFKGMSSVISLDGLSNWNTSNTTNILYAFEYMTSVTSLDGISNWDVSNVIKTSGCFKDMKKLKNTDGIQNWDLTKITITSSGMFSGDTAIEELNLASLNKSYAANDPFAVSNTNPSPANIKTFVPPTKLVVTKDIFNNKILNSISNSAIWIVEGSPDTVYTKAEIYNLYKDNVQSNIDNGTNNIIKFIKCHSITYNYSGGTKVDTNNKYPTTYTEDSVIKVSDIGTVSKEGYTFIGWSVNGSTEIKSNPDDILINGGTTNVTLKANFVQCPSITYNYNGGLKTDSDSNYPAYYVPGSTITVSDIGGVSKSGYAFGGWLVTPGNGKAKVKDTDVIIDSTTTGDVTLKATWKIAEATLSGSFTTKLNKLFASIKKIEYIRWSDIAPDTSITTVNVDSGNKGYIKAWASGNTVYLYSEAAKVYLPDSCYQLFSGLYGLKDIKFIKDVDASRVNTLHETFSGLKNVESLEPIRNWNVSNVTNMRNTFRGMQSVTTLEPLANWDVSNVTILYGTFDGMSGLTSIDAIKNWDTSKAIDIELLFRDVSNVKSLEPLRNWDVSNVTSIEYIFNNMQSVTSLEPIKDWDISNVTKLDGAFRGMTSITSLEPIRNWNVSNVTSMYSTFDSMTNVTSLEPIRNWDISSVVDLHQAFRRMRSITSLAPISNWDVSNVIYLESTFEGMTGVTDLEPLSNWNTSNVTKLAKTFWGMTNVKSLDGLEDWDVSKVVNLSNTFEYMDNLLSTDAIENWNLSTFNYADSYYSAYGLFASDSKIRNLNLVSTGRLFTKNTFGGVEKSPANVVTITLPATYLIDESLFYDNILNNVGSDTKWVVDGDNTDNTYTKADIYARYQDNVQSNIDNNTNNTIKFILLSSISADVDISKEVPAGTYGIYDEDKNLIAELESNDDNIITTIINVVKNIKDTFIYYIKQLTITDEDYNVDGDYHQFKIVATPSELDDTLDTEVVGLEDIKFNNTRKVPIPSQLDEETIEIEVDDIIDEAVDLDDNMSDTARTFNVLEYVYENHDEDYFKRSLKTKGAKSMYKYTFDDTKNLHIDLEENEDDSDYYDLSMYTDNNTDEINFNIPDEVQEELIDAGITDVKLTKINIKFNSSVATGSEIPKDNNDDSKGNTGKATPSELDKDTDDNTDSGKATPSELDKNTDNNTGDTGNTGNTGDTGNTDNKSGSSDNNSNVSDNNTGSNDDKSNSSDNKSNKKNKKDSDEDTDNRPAYDGDWIDLNGKNKNAPMSKAGGARFKIWKTSLYIRDERRTLPVHGRSGIYRTYQFDKDGNLVYGWAKDPKTHKWHYFNEEGAEVYGWNIIDGKWYFFDNDMSSTSRGEMLSNCYIKNCHLGLDGALIKEETPSEITKNAPLSEILKVALDKAE